MEDTEKTKETEETITSPPLTKYSMEETKEISSVSLVSSMEFFQRGSE